MTKVQRYKVGYYTDEWGMSSNTPCLIPDDNGYAVKFEDYSKLETELAALKTMLAAAPQTESVDVDLVGWFKFDKVSECWHPQYDKYAATHAEPEGWKQLYATPQPDRVAELEAALSKFKDALFDVLIQDMSRDKALAKINEVLHD